MKILSIPYIVGKFARLIGLKPAKEHKIERWNILKIIMDKEVKIDELY